MRGNILPEELTSLQEAEGVTRQKGVERNMYSSKRNGIYDVGKSTAISLRAGLVNTASYVRRPGKEVDGQTRFAGSRGKHFDACVGERCRVD